MAYLHDEEVIQEFFFLTRDGIAKAVQNHKQFIEDRDAFHYAQYWP